MAPTHSRQAIDSVAPAPAPDSAPEQATLVATSYTVVSGDSLWAIAANGCSAMASAGPNCGI